MVQTPNRAQGGREGARDDQLGDNEEDILPYRQDGDNRLGHPRSGQALGETMAVAMVSNGSDLPPQDALLPDQLIAAFLALNFDGAFEDPTKMFVYALGELASSCSTITMTREHRCEAPREEGLLLQRGAHDTGVDRWI